jgi:hypothetical protein
MMHGTSWSRTIAFAITLSAAGCDSRPLQPSNGVTVNGPGADAAAAPAPAATAPSPAAPGPDAAASTAPPSTPRAPGSGCAQAPDAASLHDDCSGDLTPCGAEVRTVFKAGPPPDLGQGGAIADGTYDLVQTTIYQSTPTDEVFTDRQAIRISGGATRLEYVSATYGARLSESIAPAGASLNPRTLCPGGDQVSFGPYYTASADTFTLVNGLYVKVFARRN